MKNVKMLTNLFFNNHICRVHSAQHHNDENLIKIAFMIPNSYFCHTNKQIIKIHFIIY